MAHRLVALPPDQMEVARAVKLQMDGDGMVVSFRQNYPQIKVLHHFGGAQYAFVDLFEVDVDPDLSSLVATIEKEVKDPLMVVYHFADMEQLVETLLHHRKMELGPW